MAKQGQNLNELFDVVDAADRVQRQASRGEVHANGWLHRAIHVLVFNSQGEVFLQQRSLHKDVHPGLWGTSCSGHLDAGEDYDAAACREFREELGVPAPPLQRIHRIEACSETGQEFVWVYRAHHNGPFHLNPHEIQQGRWLTPTQLNHEITTTPHNFSPSFIHIWQSTYP